MSNVKEDLRVKILENLNRKSDEEIEGEFTWLITNVLNEKQFWDYIKSWKSEDELCNDMEGWDVKTKREEVKVIRHMFKIKGEFQNDEL